jgi:hypothetical protein
MISSNISSRNTKKIITNKDMVKGFFKTKYYHVPCLRLRQITPIYTYNLPLDLLKRDIIATQN